MIKSSFVHKGNRSHDYVGGHVWSDKQNEEVYEVDASEGVEATLNDLLIQAGGRGEGGRGGQRGRREKGRGRGTLWICISSSLIAAHVPLGLHP